MAYFVNILLITCQAVLLQCFANIHLFNLYNIPENPVAQLPDGCFEAGEAPLAEARQGAPWNREKQPGVMAFSEGKECVVEQSEDGMGWC
jgi:hypothetical protein